MIVVHTPLRLRSSSSPPEKGKVEFRTKTIHARVNDRNKNQDRTAGPAVLIYCCLHFAEKIRYLLQTSTLWNNNRFVCRWHGQKLYKTTKCLVQNYIFNAIYENHIKTIFRGFQKMKTMHRIYKCALSQNLRLKLVL